MNKRSFERLGRWLKLDPGVRDVLANQGEREIATRSMSGALVYFIVSVAIALSTPYYRDYPVVMVAITCVTLVLGGSRIVAAWHLKTCTTQVQRGTKVLLFGSIYGTFIVWGLLLCMDAATVRRAMDGHVSPPHHRRIGRRCQFFTGPGPTIGRSLPDDHDPADRRVCGRPRR